MTEQCGPGEGFAGLVIDASDRFRRNGCAPPRDRSGTVLAFVPPQGREESSTHSLRATVIAAPARGDRALLQRHEAALIELGFDVVRIGPINLLHPSSREAAVRSLRHSGLIYLASPSLALMGVLRGVPLPTNRILALLPDRVPGSTCDRALARFLMGAGRVALARSPDAARAWRRVAPGLDVHAVPETVSAHPRPPADRTGRRGLFFPGGTEQVADVEAARFLVAEVMPLVWEVEPGLPCLLPSSLSPMTRRALVRPHVEVAEAGAALRSARLLVAPYAASAPAAVLSALAERLPLAATTLAMAGLGLSPALRRGLGVDAEGLAEAILCLHNDGKAARGAVRAGGALLRRDHLPSALVDALAAALAWPGLPMSRSARG